MEAASLQQNKDEICYKFEYVQSDDHLTVKEYVGVVDIQLHITDLNLNSNNVGNVFDKRGNWQQIGKVYHWDLCMRPDVQILVDRSGWTQIFMIEIPNADQKFTDCVISKWCDKTHTFQFSMAELGITPFNFTFLTDN